MEIDEQLKPNLPLLRKVLDHIDAHPEEWEQTSWGARLLIEEAYAAGVTLKQAKDTQCQTVGCIAYHAAVLSGADPIWDEYSGRVASVVEVRTPEGHVQDLVEYAQEVLGLGYETRRLLFNGSNTRAHVQGVAELIAKRAGEKL